MNLVLAFLLIFSVAAPAAARELPVLAEGGVPVAGPALRGDALLIRLRPGAARAAELATSRGAELMAAPGAVGRGRFASLGVPAVDAAAARAGGAGFDPIFPAPPRGARRAAQGLDGFYRVHLRAGAPLEQALRAFAALPEVESAEPIGVVPVSLVPNDSLFPVSTWFYQPSRRDIHAPEAWSVTTGDTSVVIGILDTGVVPYHPDLGGSTAGGTGNLFTNWIERAGAAGVDDDGNGKIDDVAGWDFVAAATNPPFPAGEDVALEDGDPNDYAGHGTMVAGCAGALTNNVIGIAGTAPVVRLMPLRVAWSANVAPLGIIDMSYAAEAIVYGMENGATVLNCSFETIASSALSAALVAAARAGVYVVFAAGNSGGPNEESRGNHLITVAATDAGDRVAGFSNLGSFVDVAAPGASLRTTSLVHFEPDSIGRRKPAYTITSGTSFAAPIVSGAVALWEARRRTTGGEKLDATNLALRLWDTADPIGALNPGVTGYGGGRLNMESLLLAPPVSRARRAGARSIGPSLVVHERSGPRLVWTSASRMLVIQHAASGETLAVTPLPGPVGRQIAAGLMDSVAAVFVGTSNGRMCGFDLRGQPLAGWPYQAASPFTQFVAGPALGALGEDGRLAVACGSIDGSLWAWSADGQVLPDFPVSTGGLGLAGAIAIADVDGAAGEEIVAASQDGMLHAVRFDGTEAAGFPAAIPGAAPAVSPVVGTLGGAPAIVVAGGTQAHAFGFDGALRWSASLGGTVAQDPALADLDGDGSDEVVVALTGPNAVVALDGGGAVLAARGWPASLAAAPAGAPVVGPLLSGRPRTTLLFAGGGVVAVDDSGEVVASFAKPGGAGLASDARRRRRRRTHRDRGGHRARFPLLHVRRRRRDVDARAGLVAHAAPRRGTPRQPHRGARPSGAGSHAAGRDHRPRGRLAAPVRRDAELDRSGRRRRAGPRGPL